MRETNAQIITSGVVERKMVSRAITLLSIGHVAAAGPRDPFTWEPIRQLLSGWKFTTEYAVSIGTAEHGQLFYYEGGRFSMETQIPTGSTSKWPSAMMFI